MELVVVVGSLQPFHTAHPHHVDLRLIHGISISIIPTYVTKIITTLKVTLSFVRSFIFLLPPVNFLLLPLVRTLVRWLLGLRRCLFAMMTDTHPFIRSPSHTQHDIFRTHRRSTFHVYQVCSLESRGDIQEGNRCWQKRSRNIILYPHE